MGGTLQLPPTATLAQAAALTAQLDAVDVIDAAALRDFDTSAVALLLEAGRRARARGVQLRVLNVPPKLRELARLYGVDGLLSLEETA